jgi:hypothetical protein
MMKRRAPGIGTTSRVATPLNWKQAQLTYDTEPIRLSDGRNTAVSGG